VALYDVNSLMSEFRDKKRTHLAWRLLSVTHPHLCEGGQGTYYVLRMPGGRGRPLILMYIHI